MRFPFLIGKVLTEDSMEQNQLLVEYPFLIGKVLTRCRAAGIFTQQLDLKKYPFLIGKVLTSSIIF